MRSTLLLSLLSAHLLAWSQDGGPAYAELQLAIPISVSGKAVNVDGQGLAGVRIDYVGGNPNFFNNPNITSTDGHFVVTTKSPAIVFRLPGYTSVRLATKGGADSVVIMRKSTQHLPHCSRSAKCTFSPALFCFANFPGMKARVSHNVDYMAVTLSPKKAAKRASITHGQGANWGSGLPNDRDVWLSEHFREDVFPSKQAWIVDSRGVKRGGRFWRQFGTFGDTAYYQDVDQASADLLDKVIDSVCLSSD